MLPENWETVQLFLAVQTQWRVAPMGGFIGLDYNGVDVEIRHGGRRMTKALWDGLKVMERAALSELNKKRE